jgi:hypothetical protein
MLRNDAGGFDATRGERYSNSGSGVKGRGARTGCEYTYSAKSGKANAIGNFGAGGLALEGRYVSATGSAWNHYMNRQEQFKQSEGSKSASKEDKVRNGRQESFRNRDTSSFFDTLIDSINRGASNSRSDDETHGFRDERLHGAGYGQGISNSNAEGNGAAQGTSSMREDGDSKTVGSGGGYSTMNIVKAAQRAAHIQTQYNQNEMAIMRLEKIISRGYMPSLGLRNQKICNSNPFNVCKTRGSYCGGGCGEYGTYNGANCHTCGETPCNK